MSTDTTPKPTTSQPFPSWTWVINQENIGYWDAPVPAPIENQVVYYWDEPSLSWKAKA
jgi:hypothetical protein